MATLIVVNSGEGRHQLSTESPPLPPRCLHASVLGHLTQLDLGPMALRGITRDRAFRTDLIAYLNISLRRLCDS